MLELEQLRDMVASGEIEPSSSASPTTTGGCSASASTPRCSSSDIVEDGAHACDYLLTVDMEMEPVPGLPLRELGAGLRRLPPRARPRARCASRAGSTRRALVLCDVHDEKTHELRRRRAALDPAPAGRRARRRSATTRYGRVRARVLPLPHELPRRRASRAIATSSPAGWYLEDYHILQGTRTEDFHAAVRRHLKRSGVPVENSKGEWGRGQHELNVRYAEALEMADRHVVFKQCLKELADAAGRERHVHGEVRRRPAPARAATSTSACGATARTRSPATGRSARSQCSDAFRWFLGGWIAHVPDVMVVLRADGQLVQALRRRLVGADAARLELRQPHRRLPRRRQRPEPAHRVPHPRRRLQSRISPSPPSLASGLDGIAQPDRAARRTSAATSTPRATCRACRTRSREATERFAASDFAKRAFGDDVVEHYAHFFRTEQARLRQRRDRLGAPALLREDLSDGRLEGQGRADHRRRQRHRPRVRAALRARRRGGRRRRRERRGRAARPSTLVEAAGGRAAACRADVSKAGRLRADGRVRRDASSASSTCCSTTPGSCTPRTTTPSRPTRRSGT